MGVVPPIQITADEVNQVVHAYLKDSGFEHTAFALETEGRLNQSPYFDHHIPRGELVELLTKALLYIEVETHCKGEGLISDCKAPFRLLKKHACAADPLDDVNGTSEGGTSCADAAETNGKRIQVPATSGAGLVEALKRKADTPADGDIDDRRVKRSAEPDSREGEPMVLDSPAEAVSMSASRTAVDPPLSAKEALEAFNREQDLKIPKKAVTRLKGHVGEVFVGAWHPINHNTLATGGKDSTIRFWTLPDSPTHSSASSGAPEKDTGIIERNIGHHDKDITVMDWSPDGKFLATSSYDSVLRIWNADGSPHWSHDAHRGPIFATKFSREGLLLTGSLDGQAIVCNVEMKEIRTRIQAHREVCLDVDWLDAKQFATCGADKTIAICVIGIASPRTVLGGHKDEINQVKFNPSRTLLASCSDDKTARIWDMRPLLKTGLFKNLPETKSIVLEGHGDSIGCVGWCPETASAPRNIVATAAFDGSARLWNAKTGACLQAFHDHSLSTYTLAFSPDGAFLATTGADSRLYVYNVKSGERVWSFAPEGKTLPGAPGGIYDICWQNVPELGLNRIALCMQNAITAVVDVTQIPIPALNGTTV